MAKQPNQLPYSGKIANKVKALTKAGVPVTSIFAAIQSFQDAPASLTTFYKLYRTDMESVRSATTEQIANKVIATALEGPEDSPHTHKSRELYLDRIGGWNKRETVESREVGSEEEQNEGAVNALLTALGKGTEEDS